MKKNILYNKINKIELKKKLKDEHFKRITASFYKYITIEDPSIFRNNLFLLLNKLEIFGRIYVSNEGINAQISVPEKNWGILYIKLETIRELKKITIKKALQEGKSFYKLTIKVRDELVAYGLSSKSYNMKHVGKHLDAVEYNNAIENPKTTVVDMRNYYESEIGRFENAIIPNVETSKELLPEVKKILKGKEKDQILLYCTGGIRCEKASAYLIESGFKNVSQLSGGIIQYAHDIKEKDLESKFKGKNFVFDQRLGERVTDDIISNCHICGDVCDEHTDCKNDACHILFIQCLNCSEKYQGCCSTECQNFAALPTDQQKIFRKDPKRIISRTYFDSHIKPKLNS
ncbi:MAG: oxygen-dependent tRNA uridine(34) hydroxylase TrhO [Fidelibacterota bacterium]